MTKRRLNQRTKERKNQRTKKHCEEIFCAGFGGQGIMFMGKLLVASGLASGRHVTWMPSYGAEVRGGTAYSMAKISDAEIASPIISSPNILIVMNKPSLLKYEPVLKEGAVLIANRTMIDDVPRRKGITVVSVPMTAIAFKLGDTRCANMVAVGAMLKRTNLMSLRTVSNVLKNIMKNNEKLFMLNKAALEKGYGFA